MRIEQIHWHSVLPEFLGSSSKVVDLGANHGRFAKAVVERFGCECVAVEASPSQCGGMVRDRRITPVSAAVAATNGTTQLFESVQSTSSSIMHRPKSVIGVATVRTVRLDNLVESLGWAVVDLLKCDIEGAELEVFESCSDDFLAKIAQISVEFHDFNGMYSSKLVEAVLARFHRLGFWSVRMSRVGHQDTLLVNHERCPTNRFFRMRTKWVDRNWLGFRRVVARWSGSRR